MDQLDLGEFPNQTKFDLLSKDEVIEGYHRLESEYFRAVTEIYRLKYQGLTESQLRLVMSEQLGDLRHELFGSSSERYKKQEKNPSTPKLPPKPRIKKPSERYPNIPIREVNISMDPAPNCTSCGDVMKDSGMTEDSEQLTVIPKKYEILVEKKVKFTCSCHGCILTAAAPARIIEGSSYSDEMIQDVALSKYCDLIPIHRYTAMAGRSGLINLPSNSLIETTHQYAHFLRPAYELIKAKMLESRVLHADETPHRMLEGDDKKSWYLWGFSTPKYCFLECHDTRSGDVASEILLRSQCEVLLSDVYSGYGKAIRIANAVRHAKGLPLIRNAHCNAHARRYFFQTYPRYREAQFYLDHYHEIYQIEAEAKGQTPSLILELRSRMRDNFLAMKKRAEDELMMYPSSNQYCKALRYFLENYVGLTLFLADPEISIDNNSQERLLRSHVVGRKTWYGTHSKRGAETASIFFTLVETCKLNGVNPRDYFANLTRALLRADPPFLPA